MTEIANENLNATRRISVWNSVFGKRRWPLFSFSKRHQNTAVCILWIPSGLHAGTREEIQRFLEFIFEAMSHTLGDSGYPLSDFDCEVGTERWGKLLTR